VLQGAGKDDVPVVETGFQATGLGLGFDVEEIACHVEGLAFSSCGRVVAEGVFISWIWDPPASARWRAS
jgi:hypothetical protein